MTTHDQAFKSDPLLDELSKVFDDIEDLLTAKKYDETNAYLHDLLVQGQWDDTEQLNRLKTAMVITKGFKDHEAIAETRAQVVMQYNELIAK